MKRYALIGFPLGHSFSKAYFTEKFEKEQIADCVYENHPLEQIGAVKELLSERELCGFNVTIPYKEQIIPYLSDLSAEARAIGAVNCVNITPQGPVGHNTDCYGFTQSLLGLLGPARPDALILGTGGASKAVQYALQTLGISYCIVSRRTTPELLTYDILNTDTIARYPLIINTTPLGTFPKAEELPPLPYDGIGRGHFLFDLVYNPAQTAFLAEGAKRGAATCNGYGMLIGQAEKSWEIWNQRQ